MKTINRKEDQPNFKPFGGKAFSGTKYRVTLDNGHVVRKSDLEFKKIIYWLQIKLPAKRIP